MILVGRRESEPLLMDCTPTRRSLEISSANVNDCALWTKRVESKPPKVKLPKVFFGVQGAPAV